MLAMPPSLFKNPWQQSLKLTLHEWPLSALLDTSTPRHLDTSSLREEQRGTQEKRTSYINTRGQHPTK